MHKSFIIFALLFLSACKSWVDKSIPKTEISAVFYHEHTRFSVMVVDGDIITPKQLPYDYGRVPIKIITDVSTDESMWYKCDYIWDSIRGSIKGPGCEIHIRSVNDLTGASWNHGKFGTGRTTRID